MTKRLRVLVTCAITAVAIAAPTVLPDSGLALAEKKKPRRKPTKKPPANAQPAPAPAEEPADVPLEIEVAPDPGAPQPIDINPDAPAPTSTEPPPPTPVVAPRAEGEKAASWEDVVVVVRKPFLKDGRFELMPSWNVTLNDNMIRHHAFTGQLNYWLTDVLAVGVEGQIYQHFGFLEPKDLVGRAYGRLPTLNEYLWGAALDFHYAPIYAKFAVFNKWMVHWEGMFTAGVGVIQSQVLPRDPGQPGWKNILISPSVGFQMRFFVARWITLDLGVRDYIFVDKFESVNRKPTDTLEMAKDASSSQLINNLMFTAGFSFWLPTGFKYTTFR